MAKPAAKIENGIALTHRAENLGPVSLPDGYYREDHIAQFIAGNLKEKPVALFDVGRSVAISEYPILAREDGKTFDIGPIPAPGIGTEIQILKDYYNYYYYIHGQSAIISKLARWWAESPYPWKDHRKNENHLKDIAVKYLGETLAGVVSHSSGMVLPPEPIHDQIYATIKYEVEQTRESLNLQIASIGGLITKIRPMWIRMMPVCWVTFEINGVLPIKSEGVWVYRSGDFCYGPYCERAGLIGSHLGDISLIESPPQYTLATWITGPLYTASARKDWKHESPREFRPTGFTAIASGSQTKDELDGYDVQVTPQMIIALGKLSLKELELAAAKETAEALKGIPLGQPTAGPKELILAMPFSYQGVLNRSSLRSEDHLNWQYCASMFGTVTNPPVLLRIQANLGRRWGWNPFNSPVDDLVLRCLHHQIPKNGCSCGYCAHIRDYAISVIARCEEA